MTDRIDDSLHRLERNARGHHHDPVLDRAADLFHTDRPAWDALPREIRDASSVYADFRDYHRRAVAAGVITDPTA